MQHTEAMDQLKEWADRWKRWVGPEGDEYRYKNMAAAAELGADALAERDALRAELAAAKNLLARIHRDGGHHTEAVGFTQSVADAGEKVSEWLLAADERDALAADNARLRAALEKIAAKVDFAEVRRLLDEQWVCRLDACQASRATYGELENIHTALSAPPAQSLAAHDAAVKVAVLREVANREFNPEQSAEERWAHGVLYGNADRIEKEAPHA